MPLRQTEFGWECPLGKFKSYGKVYNIDPEKVCPDCNFADSNINGFNLEEICLCPMDMTLNEYNRLKEEYDKIKGTLTRGGFRKFAFENYMPRR